MLPERLHSQEEKKEAENKKKREGWRGGMIRAGKLLLSLSIFLPQAFSPLAHYLPHPLCVSSPLSFSPLFFPLTSLFTLALSPSICWNSAADNACNWSDSHFSSVFGPDKEYCQHFADMASAGRIKWTLFCSVCSKLKASQFICTCLRLAGASYSWSRNTVLRGKEEEERFPLFKKLLSVVC